MRRIHIAHAGGAALIVGAIAFMGVFSYLAARFNYPEVLDGEATTVLPALLGTGTAGRLAWAIYAFLPLIWIPAGVAAFHALRHIAEGAMRTAMFFAGASAIAMILGLARWPSIHWELAQAYIIAGPAERATLAAVFSGLNSFLGNYIGEFLGELCFSIFFLLSAGAMLDVRSGFPRWLGHFGLITGISGLVGMLRNVTSSVAVVAEINNYLLPVWMIAFGIGLLRSRRTELGHSPELSGQGLGVHFQESGSGSSSV